MLDDIIKERILDFHEDGIPKFIPRDAEVIHIKDMITTISGGRRTGKTYLTYQIIDKMIKQKIIKSIQDVCYLHFDDETLITLSTSDLSRIDSIFLSLNPIRKQEKRNILFVFDEIHKIKGWEEFVLRLKKKNNRFVTITGSSVDIEEDRVAKQLRGKTFTHRLYPLSFREFLRFIDLEPKKANYSRTLAARLSGVFNIYMTKGCYPALPGLESRYSRDLLLNYFNSIVLSDFILDKKIQNAMACKLYLRSLLHKNGCPYNHKKELDTLRSMGYPLAPHTISEWFQWAQSSFLIGVVYINSNSLKKREQNHKKIYCIDWGLANTVSGFTEDRRSRVLETIIYWHLCRHGYQISYDLFSPNKYEIDFIVNWPNQDPFMAIQVCCDLNSEKAIERETRGFTYLVDKYPNIKKLIITLDSQPNNIENLDIQIIPAWKWLLSPLPSF